MLHGLLQILVLLIKITVRTHKQLLFRSGCSLILPPTLLASLHGPASRRQIDALIQLQLSLLFLRTLVNCHGESKVSIHHIDAMVYSASSLSTGSPCLSNLLNHFRTVFLVSRALRPPLEILKTGEVLLKVSIAVSEVNRPRDLAVSPPNTRAAQWNASSLGRSDVLLMLFTRFRLGTPGRSNDFFELFHIGFRKVDGLFFLVANTVRFSS